MIIRHRIKIFVIVALVMFLGTGYALINSKIDKASSIETLKGFESAQYRAPKMTHPIEGFEDCLSCHREGTGGAPITPHPERPNCTSCHTPA